MLNKVWLEVPYTDKGMYEKSNANLTFDEKKLKAFPLRSGTRQGYLLLPFLFNILSDAAVRENMQENK